MSNISNTDKGSLVHPQGSITLIEPTVISTVTDWWVWFCMLGNVSGVIAPRVENAVVCAEWCNFLRTQAIDCQAAVSDALHIPVPILSVMMVPYHAVYFRYRDDVMSGRYVQVKFGFDQFGLSRITLSWNSGKLAAAWPSLMSLEELLAEIDPCEKYQLT